MWAMSNDCERSFVAESSYRQKAMVLEALVAELSFWGNLRSTATSPQHEAEKSETPETRASITEALGDAEKLRTPGAQLVQSCASTTGLTLTAGSSMIIADSNGFASNITTSSTPNSVTPIWRAAIDAQSGKTYYYDVVSRRTQWEKVISFVH